MVHVAHLTGTGQGDYTFSSLYEFIGSMVLGDNGAAYATDGQNIQAFDINSGQPLWTYFSPAIGGIDIIAASSGGGLVAKEFSGSQAGTEIQLDSNGNPSPLTTTPAPGFPSFSWHGDWDAISSADFTLAQIALPVGRLAASI